MKLAFISLVAFGIMAASCCCCGGLPTTQTGTAPSGTGQASGGVLRRGDAAYLEVEGQGVVWLAADSKALDELNSFSSARNEAAIKQMMAQGRVMVCAKGTKVSVIDPGFASTTVRVMNGKHEGKTGVIPNEFLHKE